MEKYINIEDENESMVMQKSFKFRLYPIRKQEKKLERCLDCKKILSKYSKYNNHHFRCDKCWYKYRDKLSLMEIKLPLKVR